MDKHQLAWARHLFELTPQATPEDGRVRVANTYKTSLEPNQHAPSEKLEKCPQCNETMSADHKEHAQQFYLNKQMTEAEQLNQQQIKQRQPKYSMLLLLFVLGVLSGLINGCIMWAQNLLCGVQLDLMDLKSYRGSHNEDAHHDGTVFVYFLCSSLILAVSAGKACEICEVMR